MSKPLMPALSVVLLLGGVAIAQGRGERHRAAPPQIEGPATPRARRGGRQPPRPAMKPAPMPAPPPARWRPEADDSFYGSGAVPGPDPELAPEPPVDHGPTPVGAFALYRWQVAVHLEVGYPFVQLSSALGLVDHVLQLEAGYRGLYGYTNALFGGLKWRLHANATDTIGLGLRLIGGFNDVRKDWDFERHEAMTGGGGAFGEATLLLTARGRTHGFLATAGLRISDFRIRPCRGDDEWDCWHDVTLGGRRRGLVYTTSLEIGYEFRTGSRTSYFLAVGVDVYFGMDGWFPAMVRFRNGIALDF